MFGEQVDVVAPGLCGGQELGVRQDQGGCEVVGEADAGEDLGLDVLDAESPPRLKGKKVGLVANTASFTAD